MELHDHYLRVLRTMGSKSSSPYLQYASFQKYCQAYVQKYLADQEALGQRLLLNLQEQPKKIFAPLIQQGYLAIEKRDDGSVILAFPGMYILKIENEYKKLEDNSIIPFPSENSLSLEIPTEFFTAVQVNTEFIDLVANDDDNHNKIIRILFPEGLPSLIATKVILREKMLVLTLQKIRNYLKDPKNNSYIRQKLTPIFPHREGQLRDFLNSVASNSEEAMKSLHSPSDFSFQMWTQIATTVIKDLSGKVDKIADENSLVQAAYMLGYFNMHYRGKMQKQKSEESALDYLKEALKLSPFVYTISSILQITNKKGVPLTKVADIKKIEAYIDEMTEIDEKSALPTLIKFKTNQGGEYYIHKHRVGIVIHKALEKARVRYKNYYQKSWKEALSVPMTLETMKSVEAFEEHLSSQVKEHYPSLHSLMNFERVYLISKDQPQDQPRLDHLLDMQNQRLVPYHQLLSLNPKNLLQEVKYLLPAWTVVPVLRNVVRFLRRLFLGSSSQLSVASMEALSSQGLPNKFKALAKAHKKSEGTATGASNQANSAKAQKAAFKEGIRKLEVEILGEGASLQLSLGELATKWNPLLDGQARKNLVEDVNALCRDMVRKRKINGRGKVPNADYLEDMAQQLSENSAFDRIREREALKEYLVLYFLKIMGSL